MQFDQLRRRELITIITIIAGAAAASSPFWPLAARAQQPAMPVIGFLDPTVPDAAAADRLRAFRQGLRESGYVEGENVAIEFRWAENKPDRLSSLAAGLVRRQVAVIVAIGGSTPAFAAKKETGSIPIVFTAAQDPVKLGLVASLARPGANLTGVFFPPESTARRLELLRELVPSIRRVAVMLDPANAANAAATLNDAQTAAARMNLQIKALNASSAREVDAAYAGFATDRPDALFVGPFATDRRVQLAMLGVAHKLPATYPWRDFVDAGGLMSYGASLKEAFRQVGISVGRILKGAKPAELPVVQLSKYELVINASTAGILGLAVPPALRALADEVVE